MRFWVYGVDAESKQPCDPQIVEADDFAEVWGKVRQQRITVTGIEVVPADGGQAPPTKPRRQYEFNEEQNLTLATLAFHLRVVAWAFFLSAATLAIIGFAFLAGGLGSTSMEPHARYLRGGADLLRAALAFVFGLLTDQAATSFRAIVTTQGRDVSHLMAALERLKSIYAIQVVLICIGLLVMFFLLLLAGM